MAKAAKSTAETAARGGAAHLWQDSCGPARRKAAAKHWATRDCSPKQASPIRSGIGESKAKIRRVPGNGWFVPNAAHGVAMLLFGFRKRWWRAAMPPKPHGPLLPG